MVQKLKIDPYQQHLDELEKQLIAYSKYAEQKFNSLIPKIEGLTSVKGVSTGIVAGEAAKWHALMGSLSMLTKREVATLKKEIARTGTFSTDISQSFGQLLPVMTEITNNAAQRSAQIVAQLQAGKITLDTARSRIIALNAEIEASGLIDAEAWSVNDIFEEPFFELYDEEEDIDLGRLVVHTDDWYTDSPENHETLKEDEESDSTNRPTKEDE